MNTNKCHILTFVTTLMYAVIILSGFLKITVNTQTIREDLKNHRNWKVLDRGDDCGHSFADRIIGGKRANLGQYPWLVRLAYSTDETEFFLSDPFNCGGVIISDRYILTAAHCGPGTIGLKLSFIRIGEYDTLTNIDCQGGVCAPPVQDIEVEEYNCHHGYDMVTYLHDICVIRLAKPIKINDFAYPICLPVYDTFQKDDFTGMMMEVAGWGLTNIVTKQTSDVLMTLRVPVLSLEACSKVYTGKAVVTYKQICAGGVIGKDSCSGDSGGPLMKPFSMRSPPRYFVVGVVSFGPKNCGATTTPGVYTKLSEYMIWVLDNVRK